MDVQTNKPLSVAVLRTRNGEVAGFEDFYLLTCANTFRDIRSVTETDEEAWDLLRRVYQEVWQRHESLPETGIIRSWLRLLIRDVSKKTEGNIADNFTGDTPEELIPDADNRTVASLIQIEEALGMMRKPDVQPEERNQSTAVVAAGRFLFSVGLVAVAVFVALLLLQMVKKEVRESKLAPQKTKRETVSVQTETEKETGATVAGWNHTDMGWQYRNEDGRVPAAGWFEDEGALYYLNEEGYALTGKHHFGVQDFRFGEDGILKEITRTYAREKSETILSVHMREYGQEADIDRIIDDSIVLDNEWIYFLRAEDASDVPSLYRTLKAEDHTELIADSVSGYLVQNRFLWYCRKGSIEKFDKTAAESEFQDGFRMEEGNHCWRLKDASGGVVQPPNGYLDFDGRVYRIQDGEIKHVKNGPQRIGSYRFYCENPSQSPAILRDNGIAYLRHGVAIDALATLGESLYYSVLLSSGAGGAERSQLWRVDIYTGEAAAVSGVFQGRIAAMYPYPEDQIILMEYRPGKTNALYGKLALIQNGKSYTIQDDKLRAGTYGNGSDQLLHLWYDGTDVYCYWNNCSPDISSDGTVEVLSTRTLKIPISRKQMLGGESSDRGPKFADTSGAENPEETELPGASGNTENGEVLSEDEMAEVNRTAEAVSGELEEKVGENTGENTEAGSVGQMYVEPAPTEHP